MSVTTADRSPMKGAGEYYTTPHCMRIGSHQENISWEVAQIEENIAAYLPTSWLYLHNPDVEWDTGIIRWRSPYCKKHCLPMTSPKEVMDYVQGILEGCQHTSVSAMWHDDEGNDITASLPEEY
jgi:hypothetical protein